MARDQRRLAAIISADVAGYSRLMGSDESGTLAALKAHRRELIDPKIDEYGGRIVKTTGDGLLLEFPSVVDAVRCAVDVQRGMAERNAGVPADRRIDFRVGVNVGDIIIDGDDIIGDGVNVAARLQALAEPGGICVSRVVRDQVLDKLSFAFEDLGSQQVKNIARPIEVYRVALESAAIGVPSANRIRWRRLMRLLARGRGWRTAAALALVLVGVGIWQETRHFFAPVDNTPSGAAVKTIAVLPFRLIGTQLAAEEYFGLGLADSLITNLSNVHRIVVRPTSAVLKYDSPMQDSLAAGREQKVDALLEGTVQKSGEHIRVAVQLVRVKDGTPLWAGRFDATSTDIFKVQDSISEQAAKALLGKLTGEDEKRLTKRYTENAEAYQLYLQGRYHYNRSTEESLKKAIDYYNKAIETDQGYALAYAGLSMAYNALGYGGWARFEDVVEKQKWNAEKAIAIDDTLAEAHLALAIYLENKWEWQASEEEYRRAIALNPNFAHTWLELSGFLLKPRRWDEAVSDAKRALELEPASYFVNTHMAFIYYMTGRYNESIAAMRKAQEFAPNPDEERHLVDCRMHELETNYAEAIKCLQSLTPHDQPEARPSLRLAILYAKSGNEKESRKLIAEAISKSQRQHIVSSRVAAAFAALHDSDQAFAWLEKACDSRDPALPYVNSDPAFDNLHTDPRWNSLIQRMGLQP